MLVLTLLACATSPSPWSLSAPARVTVDSLGVRHVEAATERDLIMVQGYVTAKDRLYQMELLRRRARGELAELLGEAHVNADIMARTLGFARLGEATRVTLSATDPEMADLLAAYARGVNQHLAEIEAGEAALPAQLQALGVTPRPWTVDDSMAIEKMLTAGTSLRAEEVLIGMARLLLDDDLFADLYRYHAIEDAFVVPDFYAGASGPPAPAADPGATEAMRRAAGLGPEHLAPARALVEAMDLGVGGSNGFVVSGANSVTGHALVACDTHQEVDHPAIWYLIHLSTAEAGGDYNAVGASLPGVPFVLFGHNERVAWSPTVSFLDVADFYMELPDGDDAVWFMGESVPLRQWEEELRVRGPGAPVEDAERRTLALAEVPHHGPVIDPDALGLPLPLTLSVRWTGAQARSVARAFYGLGKARDFEGFRAAVDDWFTGGMHLLYADVDGNIGYTVYTQVPLREGVGLDLPPVGLLPGEGGAEWAQDGEGFATAPRELLPWAYNPPQGWLATANNDPAGVNADNDPFNDPVYLSGLFTAGVRAARIAERLAAETDGVSLDELADIQLDTLSILARRSLPYLLDAAAARPDLVDAPMAEALDILAAWDLHVEPDAVGPTVFHAWLAMLHRNILADEGGGLLGQLVLPDLNRGVSQVTINALLTWLDATAPDIAAIEAGALPFPTASGTNLFDDQGTEALETRDEVLLASLADALDGLAPRVASRGADPEELATWTWDKAQGLSFTDHAEPWLPEVEGPFHPKAGGLLTVDVANFTLLRDGELPDRFDVDDAPSNRFLFELDPEGIVGRAVIPGGQREDPGGAFYRDQEAAYLAGETAPLWFSADEVEADAVEVLTLDAGW